MKRLLIWILTQRVPSIYIVQRRVSIIEITIMVLGKYPPIWVLRTLWVM